MEKKDTLDICGECSAHSGKEKKSVPYIAHERDMARMERTIRRLWILSIVMFLAFAGSNAAWVWYESQFEDVVTVTQESSTEDGGNAFVNNGGDFNYGTSETDNNKDTP